MVIPIADLGKVVGMRLAFASIAKETSWLLEGFESESTRVALNGSADFIEGGWHDRNLRCRDKWSGSEATGSYTSDPVAEVLGYASRLRGMSLIDNSWSRDGRYLLSSSQDWKCVLWDLRDGSRVRTVRFEAPVYIAELHPYNQSVEH